VAAIQVVFFNIVFPCDWSTNIISILLGCLFAPPLDPHPHPHPPFVHPTNQPTSQAAYIHIWVYSSVYIMQTYINNLVRCNALVSAGPQVTSPYRGGLSHPANHPHFPWTAAAICWRCVFESADGKFRRPCGCNGAMAEQSKAEGIIGTNLFVFACLSECLSLGYTIPTCSYYNIPRNTFQITEILFPGICIGEWYFCPKVFWLKKGSHLGVQGKLKVFKIMLLNQNNNFFLVYIGI